MNEESDAEWEKTLMVLKMMGIFVCVYLPIRLVIGFIGSIPKHGALIASGLITFGVYQTFMQGDEK